MARRSSNEILDVGRLAARLVLGIRASAVDAVVSEAASPPDEIVERSLELGDSVLELLESGIRIGAGAGGGHLP